MRKVLRVTATTAVGMALLSCTAPSQPYVVPQPPTVVYTLAPLALQSKSTYARSETRPPAAAHMVWSASPRRAAKGGVRTSVVR